MKVLHIGKNGNMEKYSAADSFLYRLETIDMEMGLPSQKYIDSAYDADFIVADAMAKVDADIINNMPDLKLIHSEGVAFNSIDIDAAKDKNCESPCFCYPRDEENG